MHTTLGMIGRASTAALLLLAGSATSVADTVVGTGGNIPASGSGGGGTWVAGAAATALPTAPATFTVNVPTAVVSINSITLTNFNHTYLGDVHAVLVMPNGAMHNLFVRPALFNTGDGHNSNFGGTYVFVQSGAPLNLPTSTTGQNTNSVLAPGTYNQTFGGSPAAGATWVNGTLNIANTPLNLISGSAGNWSLRIYDWAANDTGTLGSWTLNYNPPPPALTPPQFTGGAIFIQGSADSPDFPSDSANAPGTVSALQASGSGSTSSGLVGGNATMNALITNGAVGSTLQITGSTSASQPPGYGGFANITLSTSTTSFEDAPLVLSITRAMFFSVQNLSTGRSISFTAGTGQFVGNRMLPGTYLIDINCFSGISESQTSSSTTLNWTLTMNRTCPADINGNGAVNTDDLLTVIGSWGACSVPCPPYCAADIAPAPSGNCVVNTDDLIAMITSWGACRNPTDDDQ